MTFADIFCVETFHSPQLMLAFLRLKNIAFHKTAAWGMLFFTFVHIYAHYFNYEVRSENAPILPTISAYLTLSPLLAAAEHCIDRPRRFARRCVGEQDPR
jgi:hypothetical protein